MPAAASEGATPCSHWALKSRLVARSRSIASAPDMRIGGDHAAQFVGRFAMQREDRAIDLHHRIAVALGGQRLHRDPLDRPQPGQAAAHVLAGGRRHRRLPALRQQQRQHQPRRLLGLRRRGCLVGGREVQAGILLQDLGHQPLGHVAGQRDGPHGLVIPRQIREGLLQRLARAIDIDVLGGRGEDRHAIVQYVDHVRPLLLGGGRGGGGRVAALGGMQGGAQYQRAPAAAGVVVGHGAVRRSHAILRGGRRADRGRDIAADTVQRAANDQIARDHAGRQQEQMRDDIGRGRHPMDRLPPQDRRGPDQREDGEQDQAGTEQACKHGVGGGSAQGAQQRGSGTAPAYALPVTPLAGQQRRAACRLVAVAGRGAAVDDHGRIAGDDGGFAMAGLRAGHAIADAGNALAVGRRGARRADHDAAVVGLVTQYDKWPCHCCSLD
ncbi:hypothetical protein OJJOAM_000406 [Cupriavidus sp. H18C1]